MKTRKLISSMITLCMVIGTVILPTYANDTSEEVIRNMTYTASYGTPVIDGKIDTVWDSAEWTYLDLSMDGIPVYWDTVVRTKILNDDEHVYFLVESHDKTIHENGMDYINITFDKEGRINSHMYGESCSVSINMDGSIYKDSMNMIDSVASGIVITENDTGFIEFSISLNYGMPANLKQIGLEMLYGDGINIWGMTFCLWNSTGFTGLHTGKLNFSESSQFVEQEYCCPYIDVESHWAKKYIEFVDKENLVDGITETEFCPASPMTREMFVIALARMMGIENNYIDWATDIGLLLGDDSGDLRLEDTITREQMAVFFERYLKLTNTDISALKQNDKTEFADDSAISDWAKDSVYTMQEIALLNGKDNNMFDPLAEATRAEGATVLYNLNTILK